MNKDLLPYKLAAQVVGFYETPLINKAGPKPIYYHLFDWVDSNLHNFEQGSLKESEFNTIDKRMAYLKGVFEGEEGQGEKLVFANSYSKVERCIRWINEIAIREFDNPLGGVLEHNKKLCTFPIINTLIVHPLVVDFIKDYENSNN